VGTPRNIYISQDGNWSVAELDWRDEDGTVCPVKVCRWNGKLNDPKDLGHPHSHGQGVWFVLPDKLHLALMELKDDVDVADIIWNHRLIEAAGEEILERYDIDYDKYYQQVVAENETAICELIVQAVGPFLKAMTKQKRAKVRSAA
jgi:hypothetical protein